MFRYAFTTELTSNDWRTQMTNKFVFKVFFDKEAIYLCEQIVYLRELETKLDGDLDSYLVN